MESKAGWRWFGFAGHLIVGSDCAFHLCTLVADGKYLVSTVGAYRSRSGDGKTYETLGASDDSFFETFVFKADGVAETGDPNIIGWDETDSTRYALSVDAERGHYEYCHKWDTAPRPADDGAQHS